MSKRFLQELMENYRKFGGVSRMNDLIKAVEQWSINKGLNDADSSKQYLKVAEEVGEVAAALARGDQDALKDGIGDVVVTLIILAQQNNTNLQECLSVAYDEIKDRKGELVDGVFVKESDLKVTKTLKETMDYVTSGKDTGSGWFKGDKYL